MDVDKYQMWTETTAVYPRNREIEYLLYGLVGEVGELTSLYAKRIRDGGEMDERKVVLELGDILYFVARVAAVHGVTLSAVFEANVEKLEDRKRRGVIKGSGDDR